MRKVTDVLLVLTGMVILMTFIGALHLACKSRTNDQELLQKNLITGERVVYLLDPTSGTCFHAWKATGGLRSRINWAVPCSDVPKDKLKTWKPDRDSVYLFDPTSGICLLGHGSGNDSRMYLPVACENVKGKFTKEAQRLYQTSLTAKPEK